MAGFPFMVIESDGRECTQCGLFKAWEEFSLSKDGAHGKKSTCKTCYLSYLL